MARAAGRQEIPKKRLPRLHYLQKRIIIGSLLPLLNRLKSLEYRLEGLGPEYFDPKAATERTRRNAAAEFKEGKRQLSREIIKASKLLKSIRGKRDSLKKLADETDSSGDSVIKFAFSVIDKEAKENERTLRQMIKARKYLGMQQAALSDKKMRKRLSRIKKIRKKSKNNAN